MDVSILLISQISTDKLQILLTQIKQELMKRSSNLITIENSSKTEIIVYADTIIYDYKSIIFEYERYGVIISKVTHDKIIINYSDWRDCEDAMRSISVNDLMEFRS